MTNKTNETFRQKKSYYQTCAWMNRSPNPLPILEIGQHVEVMSSQQWRPGEVVESTKYGCHVRLKQSDHMVRIYDARCIRF